MAHLARIWWRGGYVCSCVKTVIEDMFEPRMRAERGWSPTRKLVIYQHCYNSGGVAASAGTHDRGGALDTEKLNDADTKIARECGTTSWQRGKPEDTYFDPHSHWIWIGCPDLSTGADKQVTQYRKNQNGLAGNGPDKSPDVPYTTWQDALKDYEADHQLPIDEGILGMTNKPKAFDNGKEQVFTGNGDWQTVKIDDDGSLSFVSGPKDAYIVTSHWTLGLLPNLPDGTPDPASLKVGDIVQFKFAAVVDYSTDKPTTIKSNYPIHETALTTGSTFDGLTWLNSLGTTTEANGKIKLRLFINVAKDKKIRLTRLTSRILY